ncbi:MAG: multidrug ABC transporter ATP-binding protein, partial [Planctomycetia bacterium]|nr:multidrug ABC transporter ATP-binding protein [Planctomycetia bacterium]
VSSHILPELADVCNRIGIIERGELLISAEVTEVIRRVRTQPLVEIGVRDLKGEGGDESQAGAVAERAAKLLESHDLVDSVEIRDGRIYALLREGTQDYSDLSVVLVQAGFGLTVFREDEINLETAFMALTRGVTA